MKSTSKVTLKHRTVNTNRIKHRIFLCEITNDKQDCSYQGEALNVPTAF